MNLKDYQELLKKLDRKALDELEIKEIDGVYSWGYRYEESSKYFDSIVEAILDFLAVTIYERDALANELDTYFG